MIQRIVTLVVLLCIAVIAAVFASANTETIQVDLLYAVYELPQSLVIMGAMVVGVVVGVLCASLVLVRIFNERRRLRKALRVAEAEVKSLRSLPLHDAH
ncbi:MAG: LapA family protein [Pseudomonadota bacterium]